MTPVRATCPADLTLLILIVLITSDWDTVMELLIMASPNSLKLTSNVLSLCSVLQSHSGQSDAVPGLEVSVRNFRILFFKTKHTGAP